MEGIDRLREKLNELLKRHTALLKENESLHREQDRLRNEIARLRSATHEIELSQLSKTIADTMPDEESRVKNRNMLDEVIREIDQILTTLHD